MGSRTSRSVLSPASTGAWPASSHLPHQRRLLRTLPACPGNLDQDDRVSQNAMTWLARVSEILLARLAPMVPRGSEPPKAFFRGVVSSGFCAAHGGEAHNGRLM